jgi:transaldolase
MHKLLMNSTLELHSALSTEQSCLCMPTLNNIPIYADGADKKGILGLYAAPYINGLTRGLTTNPTLMSKAGIKDYEAFSKDILQTVTAKPISFEVFPDEAAGDQDRVVGPERLCQNPDHQLPQ